ncbi:hypothetical protein OHA37_25920 [Streptomyces sp. NBC_00335]|uniref:hypothetical protein n=1 Tax=unclassified Streptomyces TaxID=2593676 RepID=UPI0022537A5D|nr:MULTISPECIES: hypothetical protein [unclassified Streptomyces]MCX5407289.1 hypothetical protein [Streptomyces sp. NBC_00086]
MRALVLLVTVLCAALLSGCGGGDGPDLADQDRFFRDYVRVLNASDQDGLARLLDAHPHGAQDAKARIAAYGGRDWDVSWSRTSEFSNMWKVTLSGTAGTDRAPVRVTETVTREGENWVMAPLDGVVPRPSGAADTTPPGG